MTAMPIALICLSTFLACMISCHEGMNELNYLYACQLWTVSSREGRKSKMLSLSCQHREFSTHTFRMSWNSWQLWTSAAWATQSHCLDRTQLFPETTPEILTQFILDLTSMNLPNEFRISTLHPHLSELFSFSRDWCHSIVSQRSRLLKNLQH